MHEATLNGRPMDRRKIAIFGPLPPPFAGMEVVTQTLLTQLEQLDPSTRPPYKHVNTAVNCSQRGRETFQPRKLVRLLPQFARACLLAWRGYDAYYPISQNRIGLMRDFVLLLPFRLTRRRIVLHLHGGILDQVLPRQPGWFRRLVHAILGGPRTEGIVLVPSLRRCLEPLLEPNRIHVMRNTVLHPVLTSNRTYDHSLTVLYISTLRRSKGYRELVLAVAELSRAGVPVRLELAGELFTEEDVNWIEHHNYAPIVQFHGPLTHSEKWNALCRAHVLALPSVAPEGQPLAIIEGMAAGCAILSTAWDSIVETVGEGAGVFLDRSSGASLQKSIETALQSFSANTELVASMGGAARARYLQELSPDRFIDSWLQTVAKSPRRTIPKVMQTEARIGTQQ